MKSKFDWTCRHTWKISAYNTFWCLLGCAIGDFGTVLFFQLTNIPWQTLHIFALAIINGLLTSIMLETFILSKKMKLKQAFKIAISMGFISMVAMEIVMNSIDWWLTGGATLVWWVIPIMLSAGFVTPWPYAYWRLKKFGKACH